VFLKIGKPKNRRSNNGKDPRRGGIVVLVSFTGFVCDICCEASFLLEADAQFILCTVSLSVVLVGIIAVWNKIVDF